MGKNVIISTLPNISQNYLPKVNTSNIFANSLVYDDGSSVLINTTTASAFKLDVNGTARTGALSLTGALNGTSATFTSSTYPNLITNRSQISAGSGSATWAALQVKVTTTEQMSAGFGVAQEFVLRDADNTDNINAQFLVQRDGADNSGKFILQTAASGTLGDRLTISSTGAATFSSSVTATSFISDGVGSEGVMRIERDTVGTSAVIGALNFTNNNGATTYGRVRGGRNAAGDGYVSLGTGVGDNLYAIEGGKVGIGTTSPATTLNVIGVDDTNTLQINDSTGNQKLLIANTSITISRSSGSNGNLTIGTASQTWGASGGNLLFNTNGTERMRITSGGNVEVTTTTFAQVKINNAATTGSNRGSSFEVNSTTNAGTNFVGQFNAVSNNANAPYSSTDAIYLMSRTSGIPLIFTTNNAGTEAERMRITSGGYLKASNDGTYLGSTSSYHELRTNSSNNNSTYIINSASTNPYGANINFTGAAPNDAIRYFLQGDDNTATRFTLRSNGGLANYSANDVNLSDIRTKKDIISLESYWDKFKALEIVKFKYNDQTHDDYNIGVIAQQVESVAPEFVDVDGWGETPEDGVPLKSIYTADLHHATIKVLQEAMAKIEILESELAILKNK